MTEREPFSRYLDLMAAVGFQPSSVRGQNFLLDPTLHRWLAAEAAAGPRDTVVEIGVGLGFLTRELVRTAGHVVGIELEPRLLAIATRELGDVPNFTGHVLDALSGPGRSLAPVIADALDAAPAAGGAGLVVANLPYSISGPLLAAFTALPTLPERAVLLVQKEMAERVAAAPGSPDYGGLSVLVQALFKASVLRDVSPQVFRPRPKVVSSVLRLERRHDAPRQLATVDRRVEFGRFVRALFQQRRKALRTTLARALASVAMPPRLLPAGDQMRRAEELATDAIVELWRPGFSDGGQPSSSWPTNA